MLNEGKEPGNSVKPVKVGIHLRPGAVLLALVITSGAIFISLPIIELLLNSSFPKLMDALNRGGKSAVLLSMGTSAASMLFCILIGTPLAFIFSIYKNKKTVKVLDLICSMPAVLPPAIAGIGLLLTFGKNGMAGSLLHQYGLDVAFTSAAVVVAQFFVACPIYIQILKSAISRTPQELYEIAQVNGAGKMKAAIFYILPMLKSSMGSALFFAWIRALGEFGATIMFAGNMLGKTSTMPLYIYTLMQTDVTEAASFSVLLLLINVLLYFFIRLIFVKGDTA